MVDLQLIQSKIYEIRGQRVMLDFDLAQMYGTETAQLKRTVRRNKKRFDGEDFMFEVTRDELSRCQIGTLNKGRGSNIKYLPFAFTELGVAMLSSVLNSETAIEINKVSIRQTTGIKLLYTTIATVTMNLIVSAAIVLLNPYVTVYISYKIPPFALSVHIPDVSTSIYVEVDSKVLLGLPFCDKAFVR